MPELVTGLVGKLCFNWDLACESLAGSASSNLCPSVISFSFLVLHLAAYLLLEVLSVFLISVGTQPG